MKSVNKQIADNVIEFKQKKAEEKRKWQIHFPKYTGAAVLFLVILLIVGVISGCKVKKIEVEGTRYYSSAQIKQAVKADHYIPNTVLLKIRNYFFPIHTMPFVDWIDVIIKDRNTVTIDVHEQTRAGCIEYADKYVYFDKDGYALEVMDKRLSDVPLVTGLSYHKVVIKEKLPVKKETYFDKIIRITTLITKNELTIEEIHFTEDGEILLKKGDLDIWLGMGTGLDAKLSVLPGALNSLKKEKGTLYMDQYTEQNKIITFRKKK